VAYHSQWDSHQNIASKAILYVSGGGTAALILTLVLRAYLQRLRVRASIAVPRRDPTLVSKASTEEA
jgi:hypothetical protein